MSNKISREKQYAQELYEKLKKNEIVTNAEIARQIEIRELDIVKLVKILAEMDILQPEPMSEDEYINYLFS